MKKAVIRRDHVLDLDLECYFCELANFSARAFILENDDQLGTLLVMITI